jgi:hypothetical protein
MPALAGADAAARDKASTAAAAGFDWTESVIVAIPGLDPISSEMERSPRIDSEWLFFGQPFRLNVSVPANGKGAAVAGDPFHWPTLMSD